MCSDSDTDLCLHSVPRPCLSIFCLSLFLSSPHRTPSASLYCLSRFSLHSAIQTMSETLAVRIKATGFSHFTMKCRLSEAASKIHPERKIVENKPISYQQQLICVMLSHAELLPVLQQSLLLREVKLNSLAHWKKTKGVLSPGININLSFRF